MHAVDDVSSESAMLAVCTVWVFGCAMSSGPRGATYAHRRVHAHKTYIEDAMSHADLLAVKSAQLTFCRAALRPKAI